MSGFGSTGAMISTLNENKKLRKHTANRYKKLKEQYIGVGNENSKSKYITPLTPEELAAGRKRAIAYARKRNLRIYAQIAMVSIAVLSITAWAIAKYIL